MKNEINQEIALFNCKEIINETIKSLYDNAKEMSEYFKLKSRMPQLDFENSLLLYAQMPEAKQIAGIKAWEISGRTIKNKQTPIILRRIDIECLEEPEARKINNEIIYDTRGNKIYEHYGKYKTGYKAVYVFDETQTVGEEIKKSRINEKDFEGLVRQLTKFTPREDLNHELQTYEKSAINYTEKEILIKSNLTEEERNSEYILQYVTFKLENLVEDEEIKQFIILSTTSILNMHFHLIKDYKVNASIINIEPADQKRILGTINKMILEILQEMDDFCLSFNETVCINCLMDNYISPQDIASYYFGIMNSVRECSKDSSIQQITLALGKKFVEATAENFIKLYDLRYEKKLLTYPAFKLKKKKNGGNEHDRERSDDFSKRKG